VVLGAAANVARPVRVNAGAAGGFGGSLVRAPNHPAEKYTPELRPRVHLDNPYARN